MKKKKINILLVEDEDNHVELIRRAFEPQKEWASLAVARNLKEARSKLSEYTPDITIVDYILPDGKGTELLPNDKRELLYPTVALTSYGDEHVAVEIMKRGALDYVVKSEATLSDLPHICKRTLREWGYITERKQAECELKKNYLSQKILNKLLDVSLKNMPYKEQLEHALDVILSTPWIPTLPKGGIFLVEDDPNVLVLKVSRGLSAGLLETCAQVPFGRCLCGRAALTGKIEYAGSIDERHEYIYKGVVPHGHYNTPIISDRRVIGVLLLFLDEGHEKNEREIMFLETVTNTLASMIKRKQAEDQLRKLSQAIEQSPVIVLITDIKGKIEYVNSKFTQVTGYSLKEVVGKPSSILEYGKTSREVYKKLCNTITSGNEWRGEFCNKKKNGGLYWERASITPMKNSEGDVTHFIAVTEDITERKKMEEALLQSEKLKSIGTITTGISHEFNNILTIISGNVQMLEIIHKDIKLLMDPIHTIKCAVNDGVEITRRMLQFNRTEKDATKVALHDINDLLKQSIEFTMPRWKNMAQAKGINYYMDMDGIEDVPAVLCNSTELREVFINIILNALDAMPDGGRISFSTWSKDNTAFISISDTGEGMSDEVKKHIFDPFFTTKSPVGAGLGMSTAYGIIAKHDGNIEVESWVGKGSTFNLQLPIDVKTVGAEESSEPEQEIKSKSIHILVVDDTEEICNILNKFLSNCGHIVKTVKDGAEAIRLAKIDDYDLVLCDLAMPRVYGYDVIQSLNKLKKRPKIGIITGWNEKFNPMKGEEFKVDFVLQKPFGFSELTRLINDLRIGE